MGTRVRTSTAWMIAAVIVFSVGVANAGWQSIAAPGYISNINEQSYTQFNAPKDEWNLSVRWMGNEIGPDVLHGSGIEGGVFFRTKDSPYSEYNKHIAWSIRYSDPIPLWQTEDEEFMVQAEVSVPTFTTRNIVSQCQCAGEGWDIPIGQVYFALNLDDGMGEDVQVTIILYDSRNNYLYETAHIDKFGRPFAMTYIGGNKYSTVGTTGGYSQTTRWLDRVPMRVHITQDNMLNIIKDINLLRQAEGLYPLTEDVSQYSLKTFGLLFEVSYSEGDQAELGAEWSNVSAYRLVK